MRMTSGTTGDTKGVGVDVDVGMGVGVDVGAGVSVATVVGVDVAGAVGEAVEDRVGDRTAHPRTRAATTARSSARRVSDRIMITPPSLDLTVAA
jgi:hypothetical protein